MNVSNRNCMPIGQFSVLNGLGTTVRKVISARSQKIRKSSGCERPTLPTLSWAQPIKAKKPRHHDVVNHVPVRVDDRQVTAITASATQGPGSEQKAVALAVRDRGFSELLVSCRASLRPAASPGDL